MAEAEAELRKKIIAIQRDPQTGALSSACGKSMRDPQVSADSASRRRNDVQMNIVCVSHVCKHRIGRARL
jgi:hypothetical protein